MLRLLGGRKERAAQVCMGRTLIVSATGERGGASAPRLRTLARQRTSTIDMAGFLKPAFVSSAGLAHRRLVARKGG
jgi:hypothetical protein